MEITERAASTAIKALNEDGSRIGGYLVVWGSPVQKDLEGEYFTPESNLCLDWYTRRPVLYHHGLDGTMKAAVIGQIDTLTPDETGVWAEAQLDMHKKYVQVVQQLVQKGVLSWSSGSLAHLVQKATDGHIKLWPIVEGSATPTPAEPRNTDINTIKSAYSELGLDPARLQLPDEPGTNGSDDQAKGQSAEEPDRSREDSGDTGTPSNKTDPLPEEETQEIKMSVQEMVMAVLNALMQARPDITLTPEEQQNLAATVIASMPQPEQEMAAQSTTPEAIQTTMKAYGIRVAKAFTGVIEAKEAQRKALNDAAAAAVKGLVDAAQPQSQAGGGYRPQPQNRIQVKSAYHQHSAEDLSYIAFVQSQMHMKRYGTAWQPDEQFLGEMYSKAQKGLLAGELHFDDADVEAKALKSIEAGLSNLGAGIKANELNHSTQSSYGDEWVPDLWASQIWAKVRLDNEIAPLFDIVEMTSNPMEVPFESTDPTVYFVPETTQESELTIGSSGSVIPDSKIGSGKAQLNAKKLALRVGYSLEMEEDSIIPLAAQYRKQAVRAIENSVDALLLNGDTSASGNINYDGGTPGATDVFMALEGLRHVPLIDTTANAIDMGGLDPTLAKIRQARFSLAAAKAAKPSMLYYITHTEVYAKLLGLSEFITVDKYGPNATVLTGELGKIDGAPVIVTEQLGLTASNGKISNSGGSNTLGSLLVGHKGSRVVGYKRRVTPKLVYLEYYDAYQLVVTVRIAFAKQDADSEGVLYNIKVS